MKKLLVILLSLITFVAKAQNNHIKFDANTLFICINEGDYNQLFENPFIRDTLFICRNIGTQTDKESYAGKYYIGKGATIEFFKPKQTNAFGDKLNDIGIEFKTRKINELAVFTKQVKTKNVAFKTDTTYTTNDEKKLTWYNSVELKTDNLAISLLEYNKLYLKNLGFTEVEINKEMRYADFNQKIAGGRNYPRKFSHIKSIALTTNPKHASSLIKTFKLFNFKKINKNTYTANDFYISLNTSVNVKTIKLNKINLELTETMPNRTEKISNSITLVIHQKNGTILFKN